MCFGLKDEPQKLININQSKISMDKEIKNEFENLARMIQIGFDETAKKIEVDKRFEQVDKRFEQVDRRFDKIEGKLSNLEQDVSYLRQRAKEIEKTLERHEEILLQHSDELKIIHKILDDISDSKNRNEEIINNLQRRVERLEAKVGLAAK